MRFLGTWRFWENVLANLVAGLVAVFILWMLGQVFKPVRDAVIAMGWHGFNAWFANLGWLLFAFSFGIWFYNRKHGKAMLLGPSHAEAASVPAHAPSARIGKPVVFGAGLTIHSAEYGIGAGTDIDVTDAVRGWIKNDRIDKIVTNDALNVVDRDPAKGHRKRLRVSYSADFGNGRIVRPIETTEKARLRLP